MFVEKNKPYKIILFFFCGLLNFSFAQNTYDSITCGKNLQLKSVEKIKEMNTINELPFAIQRKITRYLKNYLGKEFYNLLKLEKGNIYKSESFNKLDEELKQYPELKPVYELYYSIRAVNSGLKCYCSRITFNGNGRLVDPISFPKKRKDFSTAKFINKAKLIHIADSLGYSTKDYNYSISNAGHFVMVFRKIKDETYSVNTPFIELSLHTGEVVSGIPPMKYLTR